MKSFEPGVLDGQPPPHRLVKTIRLLGEYQGKEALFRQQAPQVLKTLREVALIQSTESSTRLEGITAPPDRIRSLVAQKSRPANRSEQEIAGYRDVLDTIHTNFRELPFSPNVVLQLHRDLYRFMPDEGGRWKRSNNEIVEVSPDGRRIVRFKPVDAHLTPEAMETLHRRFNRAWDEEHFDRLLLIPAFVLDFLCIHPFADGNGRMARLITLWLLYRAGMGVGRYISLEKIVEETREGYYDSLYLSSQGWHEARHDLGPWWEYFLGVMLLEAYREFERRIGSVTAARGAKTEQVLAAFEKLPARFRYADLAFACPNVSRPTIKRVLGKLRDQDKVRCIKAGRDAMWEKIETCE